MPEQEDQLEIFPSGSPYQSFLTKAINELWEDARNMSPLFPVRVCIFVGGFIPTQILNTIRFDYEGEEKTADSAIAELEKKAKGVNPFQRGRIMRENIYDEEFVFALRLLRATEDCLFENRLLVPARRALPRRLMRA